MGVGYRRVRRFYRSPALRTIHDAGFELRGGGRVTTGVMMRIEDMALTKPVVPPSQGAKWAASVAVVRP